MQVRNVHNYSPCLISLDMFQIVKTRQSLTWPTRDKDRVCCVCLFLPSRYMEHTCPNVRPKTNLVKCVHTCIIIHQRHNQGEVTVPVNSGYYCTNLILQLTFNDLPTLDIGSGHLNGVKKASVR